MAVRLTISILLMGLGFSQAIKAQEPKKVVLEANDRMEFVPATIHVEAGASITLEFRNVSRLPNFFHNFVLLKKGTNVAQFGNAALNAKEDGYIPPSMASAVIVNTPLTKPGETVRIKFEAPTKGTYDFICSYPGRYTVMKGKLIANDTK